MNTCKVKNKELYEGKTFSTNYNGDVMVLKYEGYDKVLVKFILTGNTKYTSVAYLKNGVICDTEAPSLYGVGFTDTPCKIEPRLHSIWNGMFSRCYNPNYHKKYVSYQDCEVAGDFKYLSKFISWAKLQKGYNHTGYQLDKDILIKGNKVYSEDTCCFVPKDLNTLLTHRRKDKGLYPVGVSYKPRINKYIAQISRFKRVDHLGCFETPELAFLAYKKAKEDYIKEAAELYKEQIEPRVYDALLSYEVSIDD